MGEITLNEEQEKAVQNALVSKFSIISGAAGTGKTTIIKEISNRLSRVPILCTPTGKASARLREASGTEAKTVHSVLGFNGEEFFAGSLKGQYLIIDEASMMDSQLLYEVVKRKPSKLVLVGDDAQLPPVGSGQPFHDLIKLKPHLVTHLKHCYRSSEAVFKAGLAIRDKRVPQKIDTSPNEKWEIRHTGEPQATQDLICDIVKSGKLDFSKDIIICCRNGERGTALPGTVHGLNKAIIRVLYPNRTENEKWKVGDRIMCLKNFSEIDTWNGTTGTITGISTNKTLWVKGDIPFRDNSLNSYVNEIEWPKEVVSECQHAYALTVHKSQGSQYRNVIFCCFAQDSFMMLNNSLIYTAVTRTKNNCLVVGDSRAFARGIFQEQHKLTILQELNKERAC